MRRSTHSALVKLILGRFPYGWKKNPYHIHTTQDNKWSMPECQAAEWMRVKHFPHKKALIKESTVGRKKGNVTGNRKGRWQTWFKRDRKKEMKRKGAEGTNESNEKAGRSSDCKFLFSLNLLLLRCHHGTTGHLMIVLWNV